MYVCRVEADIACIIFLGMSGNEQKYVHVQFEDVTCNLVRSSALHNSRRAGLELLKLRMVSYGILTESVTETVFFL